MSAIKPLDFLKFFIDQGHEFKIVTMDNPDDWIIVNKENFEEYRKSMEKKD